MVTRHGRRVWPIVAMVVVGVLVAAGLITLAVMDHQKTQRQRAAAVVEFRQDLVNAKFAASVTDKNLQVAWKDESECTSKKNGICKTWETKSEIDASMVVAGCPLQMERGKDVALMKARPNVVKQYKFDEVNHGDDPDGIDVTVSTNERSAFGKFNPTRDEVYRYLKEHKNHGFGCFTPDPGDTAR